MINHTYIYKGLRRKINMKESNKEFNKEFISKRINIHEEVGELAIKKLLTLTSEGEKEREKTKHRKIKEEILKEVFG
jgi:hypothetical protein